jgi:hypothetical protein
MFVIMNVGTEMLYRKPGHYSTASYPTERGANIACTKLNKKFGDNGQWVILTEQAYEEGHNPMVEVTNLMSGDTCMIPRSDVGGCCDPSTERYWSM